jgi:hypothetical protein
LRRLEALHGGGRGHQPDPAGVQFQDQLPAKTSGDVESMWGNRRPYDNDLQIMVGKLHIDLLLQLQKGQLGFHGDNHG